MKCFSIAILVVFCLASCNNGGRRVETDAKKFAEMEYRAIQLREKRFALANEIRFTQDALIDLRKKSNSTDSEKLNEKLACLYQQKDVLYQQSIVLAAQIKKELSYIFEHEVTTKADKTEFNRILHIELERRGYNL